MEAEDLGLEDDTTWVIKNGTEEINLAVSAAMDNSGPAECC